MNAAETAAARRAADLLLKEAVRFRGDLQLGRAHSAAEKALATARQIDDPPLLVRALDQMARALWDLGEHLRVVAICSETVTLAVRPDSASRLTDRSSAYRIGLAHIFLVDAVITLGRHTEDEVAGLIDGAEQWLDAVGRREWRCSTRYQRSNLHLDRRPAEALQFAQEALDTYRSDAPGFDYASYPMQVGCALRAVGRSAEAEEQFEKVLDLPDVLPASRIWAHVEVAQCNGKRRRLEDALRHCASALGLAERISAAKTAYVLTVRGNVYVDASMHREAFASFDQALEIKEDYRWAYVNRGNLYETTRRYDAALSDYDRAVELNPRGFWALAHRGYVRLMLGDNALALKDFDEALGIKTDDSWALRWREIAHRAVVSERNTRP